MILHSQKSGQFNYYLSATFLKKKKQQQRFDNWQPKENVGWYSLTVSKEYFHFVGSGNVWKNYYLFLSSIFNELKQITFNKQVINGKLHFLFKVHYNFMIEYLYVNEILSKWLGVSRVCRK